MMEEEKVFETSKLQSEVMGGGRWRSPEKIIQCCTIITLPYAVEASVKKSSN
jgi:hypothetical protein